MVPGSAVRSDVAFELRTQRSRFQITPAQAKFTARFFTNRAVFFCSGQVTLRDDGSVSSGTLARDERLDTVVGSGCFPFKSLRRTGGRPASTEGREARLPVVAPSQAAVHQVAKSRRLRAPHPMQKLVGGEDVWSRSVPLPQNQTGEPGTGNPGTRNPSRYLLDLPRFLSCPRFLKRSLSRSCGLRSGWR